MTTRLTEEEFSQHLNKSFRVTAGASRPIELSLIAVKAYAKKGEEAPGMERFSVFFTGPGDCYLPQQSYSLEHDQMGSFDVFLVPIGRDDNGYNYEAVFNYFKGP